MDPDGVVFEISSDEELGWDDHGGRGIADVTDDHNWIAELLDEVNRENCKDNDDSDDVVVVGEVLPSNPRKRKLKSSSLVDLDDDCVILDGDPDKPVEVRNSNQKNGDQDEDDDDSDDLLVVSEKGQVACRDYPHPRHLCIKFSFSSTPNQSHCEQCYCYVCDSLAPCVYWGTGSLPTDHCRATDKDDFWVHERKVSKTGGKDVQSVPKVAKTCLPNQLPPTNMPPPPSDMVLPLYLAQNQVSRPSSAAVRSASSNHRVPNIISRYRNTGFIQRDKYQSDLVAQQLISSNNASIPRDYGHDYSYNPGTHFHRPVYSRTGSPGVPPATNHSSYRSWRDTYGSRYTPSSRNHSRRRDYRVDGRLSGSNSYLGPSQPNAANARDSFPSQIYTPSTGNTLNPNRFDCSPSFQPQVNPVVPQPNLATLSTQARMASPQPTYAAPSLSQEVTSQPNYRVPSPAEVDSHSARVSSFQEMRPQSSTMGPNPRDYDIGWYHNEANQQTTMESLQLEGSTALAPGNLVDYQCDNWIYDHQPVEPGCLDSPGSFWNERVLF